jgi:hypothetical protein
MLLPVAAAACAATAPATDPFVAAAGADHDPAACHCPTDGQRLLLLPPLLQQGCLRGADLMPSRLLLLLRLTPRLLKQAGTAWLCCCRLCRLRAAAHLAVLL